MGKYVLGIDGGGTKTHAALFDTDGRFVDLVRWGGTNHEYLDGGYNEMRQELCALTNTLLRKNRISMEDIQRSVLGLAGIDTKYHHVRIESILKDIGYKDYILCNDAFLGVKAGCRGGFGVCSINGTGYAVAAIDQNGNTIQIGGSFELTADNGSAYLLGKKAVAKVYESLFLNETDTCMADILFEILSINSKYDMMDELVSRIENKTLELKDLAVVVFKAAENKDKTALNILREMGEDNAKAIHAAIHETNLRDLDEIEVVLAGSVFLKASHQEGLERLKEKLCEMNRAKKISFIKLEKMPVLGAVRWGLESALNQAFYDKIINEFNNYKGLYNN